MAERLQEGIKYQTNFTAPEKFALLLKTIKENSPVDTEFARTTLFPQVRSQIGNYDASKRDTHGEISLKQYDLIEYVDDQSKSFQLSPQGYRFLELFDDDLNVKPNNEYNYLSTIIDTILSWKNNEDGRDINVGVLLFRLLLDDDLKKYITEEEFSFVMNYSDIQNINEYDAIKQKIIENRHAVDGKTYELKKADTFLTAYANSWKLLNKNQVEGKYRYSLRETTEKILNAKIEQLNSLFGLGRESIGKNTLYSPEWFKSKEEEFLDDEIEAKTLYEQFLRDFGPDKLRQYSGEELLNILFLGTKENNLCHELEYAKRNKELFGSVKGGNAFKYPLHKSDDKWLSGTYQNQEELELSDAIKIGTKVRDQLISCVDKIKSAGEISTSEDYLKLYSELEKIMPDYIKGLWVSKYFHMLFNELFPTFYNEQWQIKVLNFIKIEPASTPFERMQQINEFVKKCKISNVVFGRIFHTYCYSENDERIYDLNTILYGAPGTGKTYAMPEYAVGIVENIELNEVSKKYKDRKSLLAAYNKYLKSKRIVFTTFHQSYGYEDFVIGLKPDISSKDLKFKYCDGVFKEIANRASKSDENYVIIIDEINRGNISKIFGELITLIEDNKRWGEEEQLEVTLPSGEKFSVPNNLYILGTMNSADKSISLVDAALRRRFNFIEKTPDYDNKQINKEYVKFLDQINKYIYQEKGTKDLLIGHSYFINKPLSEFDNIVNRNIIPLLYEYFYDNDSKVKKALDAVNAVLNKEKDAEYVYEAKEYDTGRIKYHVERIKVKSSD